MFFSKKEKRNKQKGFSLIELIVVMGIFAVISGITLFNYGRFSSNLVVTNLAYEAALAVREAQVYGISVKQTMLDKKFDVPYGVWFAKSDSQNFNLFADTASDKKYDVLENEETFGLSSTNKIKYFCVISASHGTHCSDVTGGLDAVSIIFKRPDPNANIYGFVGVPGSYAPVTASTDKFDSVEIMFTSGRGDKTSRMVVTSTGQISVDSCDIASKPCPHQ